MIDLLPSSARTALHDHRYPCVVFPFAAARAPHASVLLSDVTARPTRDQRLTATKIGGLRRRLARHRLRRELAAALLRAGVSHRSAAG